MIQVGQTAVLTTAAGKNQNHPNLLKSLLISGKLEGWLRLKIKIDTSFRDESLEIFPYTWAATGVTSMEN
jgi:hypothetical protein